MIILQTLQHGFYACGISEIYMSDAAYAAVLRLVVVYEDLYLEQVCEASEFRQRAADPERKNTLRIGVELHETELASRDTVSERGTASA